MPLGQGYTAEEQITGKGEIGGLQFLFYPLRADTYVRWHEPPRVYSMEDDLLCIGEPLSADADLAFGMGSDMGQRGALALLRASGQRHHLPVHYRGGATIPSEGCQGIR